jgi:tetratricopeptide (TPR) repeat protein
MTGMDPDTAEELNLYVNLGVQYHTLKQYENAMEAYRESLRRNPRNSIAVSYLGYAFTELGDRASALAQYEILKSRDPHAAAQLLAYVTQKLPDPAPPR